MIYFCAQAAQAPIVADGQPLRADDGYEISQPLTASVRCSRKPTPQKKMRAGGSLGK